MTGSVLAYFSELRFYAGSRLSYAAALVAGAALLEGIGILAILPFAAIFTGAADNEASRRGLELIQSLGIQGQAAQVSALIGVFLLLLALRNIVTWKRDTFLSTLGFGFVDHWRSRMLHAIGGARWQTISEMRRTDLEHAITNDAARLSQGTDRLLRAGASLALVLVQLIIIALLSPAFFLLTLGLLATAVLFTLPLMRNADGLGHRLTSAGRLIHGVLGDFLASQKLARLHNAQGEFLERFEQAVEDARSSQVQFMDSQARARAWFQFIAGAVVAAVLVIGFFVLETPTTILLLALVVFARLVNPVQTLSQAGQAVANMLPAFESLKSAEARLLAQHPPPSVGTSSDARTGGPAAVEIRDLAFAYQGDREPVLAGLSLSIQPGEIIALQGVSGAGKTTLLDLLIGLLEPLNGTILTDGKALLSEEDRSHWRDRIAYLPQDPFLFDDSIRGNMVWTADEASEGEIWDALRVACADDFVRATPQRLETTAGDRGQKFSGGERQRLCLARALLRKPRLLILDEATSALDRQTEERIMGNLRRLRSQFSILLITHREESLRFADRVYRLENGHCTAVQ